MGVFQAAKYEGVRFLPKRLEICLGFKVPAKFAT